MTETVDIGTLIDRPPEVHGNRPKIAGTGVTVRRIAGWYLRGCTPEEIVRKVSHLALAQVHAALAYYHANREEIDADLAADETLYRQLAAYASSRARWQRFVSTSTIPTEGYLFCFYLLTAKSTNSRDASWLR